MLDETTTSARVSDRFSRLLSSDTATNGCKLICDTLLYRDDHVVVCPTLGSFLPFWYLIVPTSKHLNFSDWERSTKLSARKKIDQVCADLLGAPKKYIWFEHGSNAVGSATGCGADHAHLHVILGTECGLQDVLQTAEDLGVSDWSAVASKNTFSLRNYGGEYLVCGDADTTYFKNLSETAGSQFFRRVLATIDGNRSDWDYKSFSHLENARLSIGHVT